MGIEGYFTLSVVILMMIALSIEFAGTDVILFGALCVLMLTGVVTPTEAFSGFSNPAMLTVGVLFIISAAIQNTGAMNNFVSYFLGTSKKEGMPSLMLRMTAPIAFLSAFINNTPIVVIFAPIVRKWAEKLNLAPSKFLIPLSFAAVLGGLCTLIGTSTNLVVHGLLIQNGMPGLSLFELAWIGIPCTLMGLLYLAFIGHRFLPNRKGMRSMVVENAKEYVVEM
ncbi:MAG TPA: SLC13 family permease, partial [bacterium]|nr:SLC13 family permease [bacterium]